MKNEDIVLQWIFSAQLQLFNYLHCTLGWAKIQGLLEDGCGDEGRNVS